MTKSRAESSLLRTFVAKRFMPEAGNRELNRFLHQVLSEGGAEAFSKSFSALLPLTGRVGGLVDGRSCARARNGCRATEFI